jgi:hypothetical protein
MAKSSTSFKPGESGNREGRPRKGRSWADLLRIEGNRRIEGEDGEKGKTKKRKLAEVVYECALAGDIAAAKVIFEYIDGKPAQIVQHEGGDQPIHVKILRGVSMDDL